LPIAHEIGTDRHMERNGFPCRDEGGRNDDNIRGKRMMKTTTVLAIALGLGALSACNKSPTEQAAENVESNYGNVAENIEASGENAAANIEANAQNTAEAVRNEGANAANEVRNEGNSQ
jgi:hypothetical protein